MKKLMLLVAMLGMVAFAAIPVLAQVGQDSEQEGESGDLDQSFEVSSAGDNSNQCAGVQGVGNTGNAQSAANLLQYGSEGSVEVEESGSSIEVSPSNSTECSQSVDQVAVAKG